MPNQEWQLTAYPSGMPKESDFACVEIPEPEAPKDGEVTLQMVVLSVDPYMRPRMAPGRKGYIGSFELNKAIDGFIAAKVTASANPDFPVGTYVTGFRPYRLRQTCASAGLNKAQVSESLPITKFLGTLGLTGLSAYLPIQEIAKPKEGEVAFVSGAAGAVGSVAAQVLKNMGCRVVGSAGTDEKVKYLSDLGIEAFNYKTVGEGPELDAKLAELFPKGIDIYFDNVGGRMLEAVIDQLNNHSRVVLCGAISQYNLPREKQYGVKNLFMLVAKCALAQGFIVSQWQEKFPAAAMELSKMLLGGKLKTTETIVKGFDQMPNAMIGLLSGQNTGKMLVTVDEA